MIDKKKNVLKILVVLAVFLILIIAIFIFLKIKENIDKKSLYTPEAQLRIPITNEKIKLIDNHSTAYSLERLINSFLLYIQVENKIAVHSILDESYIKSNNITEDNVINYLEQFKFYEDMTIDIREIYSQASSTNEKYYIYGMLEKDNIGKDIYLVFYRDLKNSTFSIVPMEENNYLNEINANNPIQNKTIQSNNYNKMKIEILSEEDRVTKIFEQFIHNQIYYPEYSYSRIDEKYCKAKFGSIEKYKEYIQMRYNELISMDSSSIKKYEEFQSDEEYQEYLNSLKPKSLNRYKIEKGEKCTTYICIDDYERVYIFKEFTPFNYTVILDIYTTDLPEFLEKYNSSTVQEKVALNIDRFMQAMNDKSYYYAYNCLADSYKNNYFKTQEEFENYVKQNFYESSKIEFKEFNEEGDVYTYSVILTDEATGEKMDKTFIVKLGQGTEFVLSFNV